MCITMHTKHIQYIGEFNIFNLIRLLDSLILFLTFKNKSWIKLTNTKKSQSVSDH